MDDGTRPGTPDEFAAALKAAFQKIVGSPDFPRHFEMVQKKSHGSQASGQRCYWCFQIATAADLPVRHKLLQVEVVDGRAKVDTNDDPVTADGAAHPWDASNDRILCEHCIGEIPRSGVVPDEARGTGSGFRRYLRSIPIGARAVVPELGRPDMTPEELRILEMLSPGDRTPENVRDVVAMLTPMAGKIAEIQTSLRIEGEHSLETVLDDLEFGEAFFAAFQKGKETYGARFAVVAVLLRDSTGAIETGFFPQQFGATSDIIETAARSRYGARLVGIISSQMSPK